MSGRLLELRPKLGIDLKNPAEIMTLMSAALAGARPRRRVKRKARRRAERSGRRLPDETATS
jgi:hypothetical protein